METKEIRWSLEVDGEVHVVVLQQQNQEYPLYVDGCLIEKLKIDKYFNYEYRFEICGKTCSIVKLITDKEIGFVFDGKYQNKTRKYARVPKVPLFMKVLLLSNLIVLLSFVLCDLIIKCDILDKMFFILICLGSEIFVSKIIRYVSNMPVTFKNKIGNFVFRLWWAILAEIPYFIVMFFMFKILAMLIETHGLIF